MKHFFYNSFFPTPRFISLSSVGLDFSDHSLRFIELAESRTGLRLHRFAQEAIPEDTLKGGRITDPSKFSQFLSVVAKRHKLNYVRVSLPEEHVYSFITAIDVTKSSEIRGAIELLLEDNIPIKAVEAVFDFAVLKQEGNRLIVQVVAAAAPIVDSYYSTFEAAGLIPVSFELEAGAIARSVVPRGTEKSYMVVDIGEMKTGISIVAHDLPVYTSTLDIGGAILTQLIAKEQGIPFAEAETAKRAHGITAPKEQSALYAALLNSLSTLKDEINRRYIYWNTKKQEEITFPKIEEILLCGGGANLKGVTEYLSVNLKLPVRLVNPWQNMFSLETVIPELSFEESLSYATAIGLALGDYDYD